MKPENSLNVDGSRSDAIVITMNKETVDTLFAKAGEFLGIFERVFQQGKSQELARKVDVFVKKENPVPIKKDSPVPDYYSQR